MKRMTTKMSTVTPMSTLTKSKPVGQGVKNMGKGKGSKPMSMGMKSLKKKSSKAMEDASDMPRLAMKSERRPKDNSMTMGSYAGMPQLMRKAVKTGTISPAKPKAKMLPEVKVTAPGKFKRFVSKITSKRK